MKKLKYLTIIPFLLLTSKVNALSATPLFSCEKDTIQEEGNLVCNVSVDVTDGTLMSFGTTLELSNNIVLKTNLIDSNKWQGGVTGNKIGVYSLNGFTSHVSIGTIVFNLTDASADKATITLTDIKFSDDNFQTINYNGTVKKEVTIVKENNNNNNNEENNNNNNSNNNNNAETNTNTNTNTTTETNTQTQTESATTTETKTKEEESIIKNPNTGAFLPIAGLLALITSITYVLISVNKKKKFNRI